MENSLYNNPHQAKMNHLIICALVDCFNDFPNNNYSTSYEQAASNAKHYINHMLGPTAAETFNATITQHYKTYLKKSGDYAKTTKVSS